MSAFICSEPKSSEARTIAALMNGVVLFVPVRSSMFLLRLSDRISTYVLVDSLTGRGYGERMGWKLLQIVVAMSFLFANIYWQWMDNPFVAAVNAGFLAMFVTWLLSKSIELFRRRRQLRPIQ